MHGDIKASNPMLEQGGRAITDFRTGAVPSNVGDEDWSGSGSAAGPRIGAVHPNPAPGGATAIEYNVPRTDDLRMTVYDVGGRRVTTLVQGAVEAGSHTLAWDGRDEAGRPVSAGVYFLSLERGTGRGASRSLTRLVVSR